MEVDWLHFVRKCTFSKRGDLDHLLFLIHVSLDTSRASKYQYFSNATVYFMEQNKKNKNIASNPKYLHFLMTSYISHLDPLLFSNLLLHRQVDLPIHRSMNSRMIWLYDVCKKFNSNKTLQHIYSNLIKNIQGVPSHPAVPSHPVLRW